MPQQQTSAVDPGWWDLLKIATEGAVREEPFLTLVAILASMIILTVGPVWMTQRYKLQKFRIEAQREFNRLRLTGKSDE